jgi:hypothetical protein
MKPAERYEWIEAWMRDGRPSHEVVDILDSDFVCGYVDATDASVQFQHLGAPRCAQLGRDLSKMFAAGRLARSPAALPSGDASMGFPKWVYSYSLIEK